MRATLTILILAAALWRAGADWQATIGQGYAYRFGTLGSLLSARWPDGYSRLVDTLARSASWAWDPVGAFLFSLPVALALAAVAATIWVTRERPGRR
jgi:hypothetical protein